MTMQLLQFRPNAPLCTMPNNIIDPCAPSIPPNQHSIALSAHLPSIFAHNRPFLPSYTFTNFGLFLANVHVWCVCIRWHWLRHRMSAYPGVSLHSGRPAPGAPSPQYINSPHTLFPPHRIIFPHSKSILNSTTSPHTNNLHARKNSHSDHYNQNDRTPNLAICASTNTPASNP